MSSSSSTLPNGKGIPLLRFPQLVQSEIYANWDISDIYQFSTLSKVTKSIAKQMKKPKTEMSLKALGKYNQVNLAKDETNYKERRFSLCLSPEVWDKLINKIDYYRLSPFNIEHPVFAENSVESFGSLVEHVQDVFAPKIKEVSFCDWSFKDADEEELKSYLHWLNGYEKLGKLPKLYVSVQGSTFKVILENWKLDVGIMDVRTETSEVCTVDFKVDHLTTFDCEEWADFDVLKRFDCVEVSTNTNFSNQDMNLFLKDWKEGKSYHRAYCFFLGLSERAKWKKMLEGLDAELRDFRTVKRTFRFNDNRQVWDYHGGFDIKRADGKVATVGYCYYQVTDEDQVPLRPEMFEEYDRVVRVWNSEDNDEEEEIEDVIVVPEGAVDEHHTEQEYIEHEKRQRNDGRFLLMMIVW
ncbi:hypothetical protein B9Z55_003651 [Caenorhabditis nigoni]|uniref:Sdz-33 F-box domain-containing protein n=1 Tax=Caenorhabditis nigoni TaxID=1611254 RepID=A0A2G5VRF3_9PELO|nr:hypothetical protein B9Z55_003651 [Caenorhabditis nigoni]